MASRRTHSHPTSPGRIPVGLSLPLDPKRRRRGEDVDGWYPYYAGFALPFAKDALQRTGAQRDATVLDPWVGSGTTLLAAQSLGLRSIGVDLNPFAAMLASAKLLSAKEAGAVEAIAASIVKAARRADGRNKLDQEPLRNWFVSTTSQAIRSIADGIIRRYRIASPHATCEVHPASFLMLCLILATRDSVKRRPSSNPTWFRAHGLRRVSTDRLSEAFLETVANLARDVGPVSRRSGSVLLGDARRLPLPDQSVSVILTSPPYCTRIDYGASTAFELAVMGIGTRDELSEIRRKLMGTTMLRPSRFQCIPSDWPNEVRCLLQLVRSHQSYRSAEYYFPNLQQYFSDAIAAIGEVRRILQPGGVAMLVLQNSFYKEVEIDLPGLFLAIGRDAGLRGTSTTAVPVGRVMTTINTRSRSYAQQRAYRECLVCLTR